MMDDTELLAATARGDADAFAVFYRRHLSRVLAYALRLTGDPELAADLTGEVFAVALSRCARYDPRHPSALPWLMGITANKLRESRRRGRVEDATRRRLAIASLTLSDADVRAVDELAAVGDGEVMAAIQVLPALERDAIRARFVDERGYREIAAELDCSESVIRQRVSRGLARARRALSETKEAS